MTENEAAIHAFANSFTPPLAVTPTDRVNDVVVPDAWAANYWNEDRSLGIVAVAYLGNIHAYIEAAGKSDIAGAAGRVMATAMGLVAKS